MEYCRKLKFEEEPDYKFCVSLFERCMKRNSMDAKVSDFTWKQNRLSKDKEALKNSMMDVIRKKPKVPPPAPESKMPRQSGFAQGMATGMNYGAERGSGANATMMGM